MFQIRRGAQMLGQHKGHRIAGQMIHNLLQDSNAGLIHPVTVLNQDNQSLFLRNLLQNIHHKLSQLVRIQLKTRSATCQNRKITLQNDLPLTDRENLVLNNQVPQAVQQTTPRLQLCLHLFLKALSHDNLEILGLIGQNLTSHCPLSDTSTTD